MTSAAASAHPAVEQTIRPWRVPGAVHATAATTADLLPGTTAYCETFRDGPPVLVIDTGPIEMHFSLPGERYSREDLRLLDTIIEAWCAFRTAAQTHLY